LTFSFILIYLEIVKGDTIETQPSGGDAMNLRDIRTICEDRSRQILNFKNNGKVYAFVYYPDDLIEVNVSLGGRIIKMKRSVKGGFFYIIDHNQLNIKEVQGVSLERCAHLPRNDGYELVS